MCVAHSLPLPPFKAPDICVGHEEGTKRPKDTSKRKSASHCSLSSSIISLAKPTLEHLLPPGGEMTYAFLLLLGTYLGTYFPGCGHTSPLSRH